MIGNEWGYGWICPGEAEPPEIIVKNLTPAQEPKRCLGIDEEPSWDLRLGACTNMRETIYVSSRSTKQLEQGGI